MVPEIPGLLKLSAHNPGAMTGTGNWTYLLTGRVPMLIDAGVGERAHVDDLSAAIADPSGLTRVVVTHAHADHASGVIALAARWPTAKFLKFPWPEADGRYPVSWATLTDGQQLDAGDMTLGVVHTPGHSPDHVCLWHAETRTLFGGDLLVEGSTVVIPGSRGGSLIAYLASLARIESLRPSVVLPAHGPAIEDPATLIGRYRAHRLEREAQILDALASGADTVTAIAARVYPDLKPVLRPVAEETVHAHVAKLREEGRVGERDGHLVLER
jgi:glyoxylase-like metal-dependent hydrolase (beta-lactamase superfamily II)